MVHSGREAARDVRGSGAAQWDKVLAFDLPPRAHILAQGWEHDYAPHPQFTACPKGILGWYPEETVGVANKKKANVMDTYEMQQVLSGHEVEGG